MERAFLNRKLLECSPNRIRMIPKRFVDEELIYFLQFNLIFILIFVAFKESSWTYFNNKVFQHFTE